MIRSLADYLNIQFPSKLNITAYKNFHNPQNTKDMIAVSSVETMALLISKDFNFKKYLKFYGSKNLNQF